MLLTPSSTRRGGKKASHPSNNLFYVKKKRASPFQRKKGDISPNTYLPRTGERGEQDLPFYWKKKEGIAERQAPQGREGILLRPTEHPVRGQRKEEKGPLRMTVEIIRTKEAEGQ